MSKEIMRIKNEKALLEYLYKMLSLGYTDGITESEYFKFIHTLEVRVNSDTSMFTEQITFEKESFSYIVEKALKILDKSCVKPRMPLVYSDLNGQAKIVPTYDLRKIDVSEYQMFNYPSQIKITKQLLEELIPKIELSDYDFIRFESLDGAKKVASFYINELACRYVGERIKFGAWPSSFNDVDKYIFEHDFAKMTMEEGTKEAFIKAYVHATKVVAQLKDCGTSNDTIMFSNDSNKPLAYANYLKMVLPEEIRFLTKYSHHDYALNDASIDVFTKGNQANFKSVSCIECAPYGRWSDVYERKEGIIEESVKIMEKRIGNRIY